MPKRKKSAGKTKKPLDTVFGKRGKGRPARVPFAWITGRADNYRRILNGVWERLWPLLSEAQTEEAVKKAFQEGATPYDREFMPYLAALVLRVVHDPKFPKRRAAQINFLADSLAGWGRTSPRRSRDICEQERAKERRAHHIIRYEFYVECSCGYKGRSRDHACRKCGAQIGLGF